MTSCADDVTSPPNHVTSVNTSTTQGDTNSTSDDCHDEGTAEDGCRDDSGTTDHSGQCLVRDLHWLIGRMNRLARFEAGKHPHQALKVV